MQWLGVWVRTRLTTPTSRPSRLVLLPCPTLATSRLPRHCLPPRPAPPPSSMFLPPPLPRVPVRRACPSGASAVARTTTDRPSAHRLTSATAPAHGGARANKRGAPLKARQRRHASVRSKAFRSRQGMRLPHFVYFPCLYFGSWGASRRSVCISL